jgi:ferredoxin
VVTRVVVDLDRCDSNALCQEAAPRVFQLDDSDVLHVLDERPGTELLDGVEAAARACPKLAITLVDEASGVADRD